VLANTARERGGGDGCSTFLSGGIGPSGGEASVTVSRLMTVWNSVYWSDLRSYGIRLGALHLM
jgi:hypothetical protein